MFISELLFGKSTLPVASEVINMTETRHKEIVNNIANMDTPYYKARDINTKEFSQVLGEAIDERKSAHPWRFRMGSSRDVLGRKSYYDYHFRNMRDLTEGHIKTGFRVNKRQDDTIMRHDQNNVTPEGEMARLAKNSITHKTFFAIAKDKFSQLEGAIRLRV